MASVCTKYYVTNVLTDLTNREQAVMSGPCRILRYSRTKQINIPW